MCHDFFNFVVSCISEILETQKDFTNSIDESDKFYWHKNERSSKTFTAEAANGVLQNGISKKTANPSKPINIFTKIYEYRSSHQRCSIKIPEIPCRL